MATCGERALRAYDPERREYQHPSGIVLLTPEGRVSRYLFGVDYSVLDLRLGLVEASQGKIAAPTERALLLTCLSYDPTTGRYTFAAQRLMDATSHLLKIVVIRANYNSEMPRVFAMQPFVIVAFLG